MDYTRAKNYHFKLQGVGFDNNADAFDEVEKGDLVSVEFENDNPFDKNALAVFTTSNKLLGYIPRNQRKLIKTLRANPITLGFVIDKFTHPPSQGYKTPYRLIEIELWAGFSNDEIELEKRRREK